MAGGLTAAVVTLAPGMLHKCPEDVTRTDLPHELTVPEYGPATLPLRTEPLRSLRAQKRRQRYAAPLTEQIAVLSRRSWKAVAPKVFKRSSLLLHGGNATLAGLMWWQLGYKERDVFPRYTLAFAIPIAWIFFPLLDALPWFGAAQNMLRKDLACNAYRLEAWFVVDSTMNLVPMCAQSLMHLTVESCVEINQ